MSAKIATQLFLVSLLNLRELAGQIINDNEGLNSIVDDCSSPWTDAGLYEKISPSSKYMVFRPKAENELLYTYGNARRICESVPGLEVAEVTSKNDLRSLEAKEKATSNMWIGLNHRATGGVFLEADGSRIIFQSFIGMEPNNEGNLERCVILKHTDGFLTMADVNCESEAGEALCQFKKGTHCFHQSAEETAIPAPPHDSLESVGSGGRYFIGKPEKNWEEASDFCFRMGKRLVVLDESITQEVGDAIKKNLIQHHLHPLTQFWTGGVFVDTSYSILKWEVADNIFTSFMEPPHSWASATTHDFEPMDQSGSGLETCLDISFENIGLESSGNYAPFWRASNCKLPKFFICETIEHGVPQDVFKPYIDMKPRDAISGRSMGKKCTPNKFDPVNYEVDLNKPMDDDDIVKFLIFNIEHDLKSGDIPLESKESIRWKESVVDLLVQIAIKVIPNDYVDHGLLHVVKIVILMYLNSASNANDTVNHGLWEEIYITHLINCMDSAKTLMLTGTGLEVTMLKTGVNTTEPIFVPEEYADGLSGLDSSIDIFWFLFSLSVATCYKLPESPITFAADMHVMFIVDFIQPLRRKWVANVSPDEPRKGQDFTLALGDVDYETGIRNLRFAVSAAYAVHNISDLELVRPLESTQIDSQTPLVEENKKTGKHMYPNYYKG